MIESKNAAIEVRNLTKSFGNLLAVDQVSFEIEKGMIVGILGPNGAGKTTIIRLITGIFELDKPSQVKIYSSNFIRSAQLLKKEFGIVPEISNAYSDFTVLQNLIFSGKIYGLSKEKILSKSDELLKRFELDGKTKSKTKSLSKGLKQRLNLCLALLHEPSILILDEPMSGLDPLSVNIVRNQILELKEEGKTILITTHNMQEAQRLCDRVLIMNKGKIIADQAPEELLKKIKLSVNLLFDLEKTLSKEQRVELKTLFNHISIMKELKNQVLIVSSQALEDINRFYNFIKTHKISVSNFKMNESTLEDVFIQLIQNDSIKREI